MSDPSWLPPLIEFSDFGGNWFRYVEAVYDRFHRDFVVEGLSIEGKPVRLMNRPLEEGKHSTFWHLTTEGEVEDERSPDFRRCERIGWPRALVEAAGSDRVLVWRNRRGTHRRVLLALVDFSYVVVLEERSTYVLLWTAYPVDRPHQREKLAAEYRAAQAQK